MTTSATSDEIADLVKRLRTEAASQAHALVDCEYALRGYGKMLRELDDEASRLRAELAIRNSDIEPHRELDDEASRLRAELASKCRETEEMRERTIEECAKAVDNHMSLYSCCCNKEAVRIIRALSAQPDPHNDVRERVIEECASKLDTYGAFWAAGKLRALSAQPDPHKEESKPDRNDPLNLEEFKALTVAKQAGYTERAIMRAGLQVLVGVGSEREGRSGK